MMFRCSRRPDGRPIIEAMDAKHEALAFFLMSDVGVDLAFCDELLESIRQVSSGESPEIITGANVHTLTVTPGAISLENDFAIPPIVASLSLNETIDAIEEWKRCISACEGL